MTIKRKISYLIGVLTLCSFQLQASSDFKTADSFKAVESAIEEQGSSYKHTLLVMDDDDTLTMMRCPNQANKKDCQYLGGPAWYSWQSSLLNTPNAKYRIAKDEADLLKKAALLLSLNDMDYTETSVPEILTKLSDKGVKLVVLTARGGSNLSATESQFESLLLDKKKSEAKKNASSFFSLIQNSGLKGLKSDISSIAGPISATDCNAERSAYYQSSIMYVAGQNKGSMLHCLLAKTQSGDIKNIVFIDDTLKNVKDVQAAFKDSKNYNVTAIHYTALSAHKMALTQGKDAHYFQQKANERWLKIKKSLSNALLKPAAVH
ncbi:DUF2608 domain-containing protein [Pleionea sediminis]|uniref:DUF2608 domain-containing protein n=1 Tax=Pleionea sediminis TaxID=2569479 RepID=UPI0013DE7004|nr:DUF2608 domain-containing protein [Pleionea sediminis]